MIGKKSSSDQTKKKLSADIKKNKQMRRRWITFLRMCRYGVNNFSRNAWLTVAATAVMTITLLIIFGTLVSRTVLLSTVGELQKKVDVSIYLENKVKQKDVQVLIEKLRILPEVQSVAHTSAEEAKEQYIEQNDPSEEELDSLAELEDPFPQTIRVNPKNLNNMASIEKLVTTDDDFQQAVSAEHKPSFAGERRESIENIGRGVHVAERAGLVASAVFISISILIIFNTIRMAIFNRKEEIEMMKLIGAEKSFIQGPFIVEAVMYGFFAAIIASIIGIVSLGLLAPRLKEYGIAVDNVYGMIIAVSPFIVVGLIAVGACIGVISSFFAVRKHLKI